MISETNFKKSSENYILAKLKKNHRLKDFPKFFLFLALLVSNWDHAFSTYAKLSGKLIFLMCAYQGVRSVSFLDNFSYYVK